MVMRTYLVVHELLCMRPLLKTGIPEEVPEAIERHVVTVEVAGDGVVYVAHSVLVAADELSPFNV